jgi:hypothetical protein
MSKRSRNFKAKNHAKLILENTTDLPMKDFLRLAQGVVSAGRISNNDSQYCYVTAFTLDGKKYYIASDLNKKSDKLILYYETKN